MAKKTKSFLSMMLSLSLLFGSILPVGAVEAQEHNHAENAAVVLLPDEVTEQAEKSVESISLETSFDSFTVETEEFSFDIDFDAATVLADPNVVVDQDDPIIIALEAELKNITVLDEETGAAVALTEEQIGTVLYLYQQYANHWAANANVLGVQTPFFLQYNDTEDGLGILGEMLVLANVSVEAVRTGQYSYDDLIGMIQNFTYADVLGVAYYGDAIKAARDEVLALIEESGAQTEAQKLLILNDWMAHINTFDMPYIMNNGKTEDEKPMVAEDPQQHEHYQDVYNEIYADYLDSLDNTFRQQINDGLEANFFQQYYSNAIKAVVYEMIYAQAEGTAIEEVVPAIQEQIRAEAEAAAKQAIWDETYDTVYAEYVLANHEHELEAEFAWAKEGTSAVATISCKREGCDFVKEVAATVVLDETNSSASTCNVAGQKIYTATVNVLDENNTIIKTLAESKVVELELAEHQYENGTCTVCGLTEPEVPEGEGTEGEDTEGTEPEVVSVTEENIVLYSTLEEDAAAAATEAANKAVETEAAAVQIAQAGEEALAALTEAELTAMATAYIRENAEIVAQLEAAANENTEGYMTENAEAIAADPVAFVNSQEMFQYATPLTDENGDYILGDDGNPMTMTIAEQLHAGWDAFWADAQENGVEVDPVNMPGHKMTVTEILEQQMNTPMEDLPAYEDGTHMTPNEAIPVYAAQAAAGLTDGVINYWEGSQFGALGFGTSVCLGYTKAFTYLVQCMHPEVYLKEGATDIDDAANWKTAADLYYDEEGNLDITQDYVVDAVRITFDASVTMYGETEDNFNSDHFWNAVKVDGQWYYVDPCYTDVFTEVMMRDRVETDGSMNHLYFMFSHPSTVSLYEGNYKEIKSLYEEAATDTSYEDSWISRIKSNVYFDGGYAYYVYDSTDMLTMMEEYENQNSEADIDDSVYKLVRHQLTTTDAGETADEYEELIYFNYQASDDAEVVSRVWDPETQTMVDNEMLTQLYAKHEAYVEIYPSLAITAALYGDKVYFNLANCILSYDIATSEVAVVKEYNTVYGVRDKQNPFGGMAFTTTTAENADFTVENHPIAGMTIKNDGNIYVSVATNFAFISGKADRANPASEGYGYVYEESNYNTDYNSYMDYSGYEDMMGQYGYTEEINDNDEFMWTANFVETLSMSHLAGTSHTYGEVTVAPFCGEDGYTENRCTTCGVAEADTRVVEEESAREHHFLEFAETYYTKDDEGNWNTGVCYVCTVCGMAVSEPVEPTGQAATDEAMAEYEKELAIYEAAKESAGHDYVPVDAEWAEDYSTVTFSAVECSSDCMERKAYRDFMIDDEMISVTLAEEVVAETSIIEREGVCPEGVTLTYGASGEVEADNAKKVTYAVAKAVELEPADHQYENGACIVCGDCSVKRIFGADRMQTALKVADKLKETLNVDTFDAIILTNGESFADALSGSYLANKVGAPILLCTKTSGVTADNLEFIQNNLSEDGVIYLLGGEAVIPASVEESLSQYTVKRLAGATRFETNLAILEEAGVEDEEILISMGQAFADSLSASATGLPILLLDNNSGTLTEQQIAFLEEHKENEFTILGGEAAISTKLENKLEELVGKDLERVYGSVREETSTAIAKKYYDSPESVVVAYSLMFPDGMCAGPLAYALKVPLVLTRAGAETTTAEYIADNGIEQGLVLGGSAIFTEDTIKTVFGLDSSAIIEEE